MAKLHEVPGCRLVSVENHPKAGLVAVRRLRCTNPSCARRTFCLPITRLLAPRARRTRRLAQAQQQVGFATSALAGACLLARLAMPTSGSTVLRLMHAAPLPRIGQLRAVGVD